MGLAASQGRYLCLTARMSDLIYEGQQISQQRLALSQSTQAISDEYNEAMSNTVLKAVVPENIDGQAVPLTFDLLTNQDPFSGLCMRIVDLNGNIVIPKLDEYIEVSSKNADGEEQKRRFSTSLEFLSTYMPNLSDEETTSLSNKSLEDVYKYYMEKNPNSTNVEYSGGSYKALKNADERFNFDEQITDPKYLQQMLTKGEYLLEKVSIDNDKGWASFEWQGSTEVSEVYDTSDDAAAEAKYETAMADIQRKDKILELRLEQVETEESAVEKELESVKQTIDKNIEDSFKTFA